MQIPALLLSSLLVGIQLEDISSLKLRGDIFTELLESKEELSLVHGSSEGVL